MLTNSQTPIPLIFDDDGSQDGMTALAYILANPQFDLQAITISQGIATPQIFVDKLELMLGRLEVTGIPVGIGRPNPLEGNNAFPDFIREASNTFWHPFVELPTNAPPVERWDAVELIIETIKTNAVPVAILATGPLTNIAEALRQDPTLVNKIKVIQVMGGAIFTPGNLPVTPNPPFSTNLVSEFNIWVDPVAAQEVFQSGVKIQLTPLDATNNIEFTKKDLEAWLKTGTRESLISAEFLNFALNVIESENDPNPVWDLVAAINLSEPNFSKETPLHIQVDTEGNPAQTQGQTLVVPGLPPNVLVSLDASFNNLNFTASNLFSVLGRRIPDPNLLMGSPGNDGLEGGTEKDIYF